MKRSLLCLFAAGCLTQAYGHEDPGSGLFEKKFHRLFSITRSLNKNEVVYEARDNALGFDSASPLNIYWILWEKKGETEPLTFLEKMSAYGVSLDKISADEFTFTLKAVSDRTITVRATPLKEGRTARAFMRIQDEECALESVYVQLQGTGITAKVSFVEIRGTASASGVKRTEKFPGNGN